VHIPFLCSISRDYLDIEVYAQASKTVFAGPTLPLLGRSLPLSRFSHCSSFSALLEISSHSINNHTLGKRR
jgi:hypothetical protein